jgi:hypothetical protein
MLLSRLRGLSAELDERVPARAAFRRWRRTRPFWGGVCEMLGGLVILALPLAPLPVMIHVGMAAASGVAIGAILIAAGLFFWFAPAQRAFVAVVSTICALVSVVTTNLGGGGIGALLALLGAAMAFGWRTTPPPARPDPIQDSPPPPDAGSDDRPTVPLPPSTEPLLRDAVEPDSGMRRPAQQPRRSRWRTLVITLPIAVSAGLIASVAAHRPAVAEAAAPAVSLSCVPVPGATRPWWIPERLWLACPNPSTNPSASSPASGSPQPTPTPTGGPVPTTGPARPSGQPDVSASSSASPSAGTSAGPGTTTPPRMRNPGAITEIRYGKNVPQVSADTLRATGFTFRGTVDLPTSDGTVKALVFHADNLKARNYRIRTRDPGANLKLGIDLDIDDVDIYATHLGGLITVPYLDIPLLPVEITADLIPTWLPLNIWLPAFSGNGVKAGQVFIRAGTVRGSDLSADVVGSAATRA